MKISKTRQIDRFRGFIQDKSSSELFQLRVDHATVHSDNNGKRTKAQISRNVRLPVETTTLLLDTPLGIWDSIMHKMRYYDWLGRRFGETVEMSVIRRNGENAPCGTKGYEPENGGCLLPHETPDHSLVSRCKSIKAKKAEEIGKDWHQWVYGGYRNPLLDK